MYKDITFCRDECGNKECFRNAFHVPSDVIASWSYMKGSPYCMGWKPIGKDDVDAKRQEFYGAD